MTIVTPPPVAPPEPAEPPAPSAAGDRLAAWWRRWAGAPLVSPWDGVEPIRGELLSLERLQEKARVMAASQHVSSRPMRGRMLTARLADNAAVLLRSHHQIAEASDRRGSITPAAEWLLDNYYLVERQVHDIHTDLPPGYYRQLPKLASGLFAGFPRVFALAWTFVADCDSRIDPDLLCRFIEAYQQVTPLSIGELWALAITLRIVLIENLRRLAEQVQKNHQARRQADGLADRLLGIAGTPPEAAQTVLDDLPMPAAMAVQLIYRLRDQDPQVTPALVWLDQRLSRQGVTADTLVAAEHLRQGAATVTVQNIITSMRLIGDIDWTQLIERISLVDQVLAGGSDFAAMDFPTRNLYRSAVEDLARGSGAGELMVARRAVAAAASATAAAAAPRQREPGFYLLAGGRAGFEILIGYHTPFNRWPQLLNRACGIMGYAGAITLVAGALLALPLALLVAQGVGTLALALLAALGIIPAVDVAVALINRTANAGFGGLPLPGLALLDGIPPELRTLVVVPALLTSEGDVRDLVRRLEVHHLACRDVNLSFALLSDWVDAASEQTDADQPLLAAAQAGILALNQRYPASGPEPRFLLLHRRRQWNQSEGCWMGWERKRGKLHELNLLLRGGRDTSFLPVDGQMPLVPSGVRYVVTLDADTRVPLDCVRRLIGKMAHPLNQPVLAPGLGRVVAGHAVMQPRVTPSMPTGTEGSLYQRSISSMNGIDPYAAAVSDLYQDLFGEGSYAGKGIYDVDAFESALQGRVPESTLLSHDLLEGIFARAALVSDVEVIEEFPAGYLADAQRHHRWARGDWQLLPWLFGCPAIPAIGRWKMLDNLRRTLSAPAALVGLLAGWALPPRAAATWTGFVLATLLLPSLFPALSAIIPRRRGVAIDSYWRSFAAELRLAGMQFFLRLAFLAHQAALMTDAIVRTLLRLGVSRQRLLEWVTAAQASSGPRPSLVETYRRMAAAPLLAVAALADALLWRQGNVILALPMVALWLASPALARWVSQPGAGGQRAVSAADRLALRLIARQTWRFFETFVSAADNYLPPDNFQEDPKPVIAHRTSPTNIGLYLLSVMSARNFGWCGTMAAIERLEDSFASMAKLARFRGHFYNWYDTNDLRPLEPAYVSTVDSGNLAGHLIALANGLEEWQRTPVAAPTLVDGLNDALALASRPLAAAPWPQAADTPLVEAATALRQALRSPAPSRAELTLRLPALSALAVRLQREVERCQPDAQGPAAGEAQFWVSAVGQVIAMQQRDLTLTAAEQDDCRARLTRLAAAARSMAMAMQFGFLFDGSRKLLSIGYRMEQATLDLNCYDLLASEARLASYLAIAKGDVPARHWFRLGRAVTAIDHAAALISWSGSMFEYLMPSLVMTAPQGSLLATTNRLIVARQIAYAAGQDNAGKGVPWGISESAYNARDLEFTYQYSNFGVPGLGLKRGLGDNLVVAPYATGLAGMVDPTAAAANFRRLAGIGALGRFGFYEAIDYTPSRLPSGQSLALVRAFMAHHQGMTIVAIADALGGGWLRRLFHREPMIEAAELLLQERTPRDIAVARPLVAEGGNPTRVQDDAPSDGRRLDTPHSATPATHLLSNGHYSVMLTAAGSGYSRWDGLSITRWREDPTCDDWGAFFYLRDCDSGAVWSAGFQPSGVEPDEYSVLFKEDRGEIVRCDGTLVTSLDVLVSAEDAGEVRRLCLHNLGRTARSIEITAYAELVLTTAATDQAHPAFAKMFVETEYLADQGILLATRRSGAGQDVALWVAQFAVVDGPAIAPLQIETDRARFLGRGGTPRRAAAMLQDGPLSGSAGVVLDPIFALRHRVRVDAGGVVHITVWTMAAASRQAVLDLVDRHRDAAAFDRAGTLAWTQAQVQLHHVGIDSGEAGLFQRIASHLLYAAPSLRPSSDVIRRGAGRRQGLWGQGISGDLPILVLRIADVESLDFVRQILQAHEYWRMKQLAVDVVLLNERASSYAQDLQGALETLLRISQSRTAPGTGRTSDGNGKVVILRTDLLAPDTHALLLSTARVVFLAHLGRLADQLDRLPEGRVLPRPPAPARRPASSLRHEPTTPAPPPPGLELWNGLGGFAEAGQSYVTRLEPGQWTPAPWINIVANEGFGFQVSVEGGGFSWSGNSRENQLTPWSNDAVSDPPGEVFYLSDADRADLWSATPLPIRDPTVTYRAEHGHGYSRFSHSHREIEVDLLQFVPLQDPVKISRLRLGNRGARRRRLSVTAYVAWVLAASRSAAAAALATEIDGVSGCLLARNPASDDFASRVAFLDGGPLVSSRSGDRRDFIGRNGSLAAPAALQGAAGLGNRVGAGLDPCGAVQLTVELAPGESIDLLFLLGECADVATVRALVARVRAEGAEPLLAEVTAYWQQLLGSLQVTTPDRAMDIMLNGWLLYQALVCRVWARSAFYQASGAYGFRDQLQDGMALASRLPAVTRAHLLRAAARQFVEGDVQHWWLPDSGRGVRTTISDDRLWLAFATAHYVEVTADHDVLAAPVGFIAAPALAPGEADQFTLPTLSPHSASLFEHCALAIDCSLKTGRHGLPLFGGGDWNDGMNLVGAGGQGESVWLGWFLYATLKAFAPLAAAQGDTARVERWHSAAEALRQALEEQSWDGAWYLRGWYDDGTPLGSASSDECRIDSIAQSWAVLSGAAPLPRAQAAMAALGRELIRQPDRLAPLFTPAFDKTARNPGYIKGYPPGIRENGGQYNHAAAWSVMASASLGDGDQAALLFSFLNPISRSLTADAVARYKVEPYVVVADIYTEAPHIGRGGWSWYTGSAGWLQRAGIETILGLRLSGASLRLTPCIPRHWPGFSIDLAWRSAHYHIQIENGPGALVVEASLDGVALPAGPLIVALQDDGEQHRIQVKLG